MKNRIKEIRKKNAMTQEQFAANIGISGAALSMIEAGKTTPSNQTITNICNFYHINEEWLRNGTGEMGSLPPNQKVVDFISRISESDQADFKIRMISLLADLTPSEWKLLEKMADRLSTQKKEGGA